MKLLTEDDTIGASIFKDGHLTQLMIAEHKGRRHIKHSISYPLYLLLKTFLYDYGIIIGGAVNIGEYQVTAVTINADFPVQNEPILRQLYSFTAGTVNIQLVKLTDEDCAYAFDYDMVSYKCTLNKYVYGRTVDSKEYDTLAEMLADYKAGALS